MVTLSAAESFVIAGHVANRIVGVYPKRRRRIWVLRNRARHVGYLVDMASSRVLRGLQL